jgi:Regulator of ribonuclease activity B
VKVWHYLYLPDREAAERVARQLQGAAYATEVRESEPSWLVRASHTIPRSQDALEAIAESLTQLVVKEGGEYDGWERETPAGGDSSGGA